MGINLSWRIVKKKNNKGDESNPIYLRIRTSDGSSETTINTGKSVESKYWDSGNISTNHPDYTNIMRTLNKVRQDVEDIIVEFEESNKVPNPKLVKKEYESLIQQRKDDTVQPLSFKECWEKFLHKKKVETSFYTHRMYEQLYERLKEFAKYQKVKLTFDYILSDDFEIDFKEWSWKEKKHKNSYVRKNLTSLKSFLNYCVSNGYLDKRIGNFNKPKVHNRKEIIYLTKEEVLKLSECTKYNYEPNKSYPKEIVPIEDVNRYGTKRYFNNWELAIDIMVFMCTIGCRWNDIHYLTWDAQNFDNETFTWENQKTKKYTTVPLDNIGIEILKKYGKSKSREMRLFPKYSLVKFNKTIKKVFKDLNMNRLVSTSKMMGTKSVDTKKKPLHKVVSSHTGRRTFIMNLLEKGLDYKTIMSMTGHSDVKSLMKYISVDESRVEMGRNLYSGNDNRVVEFEKIFKKLSKDSQDKVIDYMKLFLK